MLSTNESDEVLEETPDDADAIINDDEDNLICERNLNADNYRLCKAKTTHDAVLGKIGASIAKKTLTATEVPQLDTRSLNAKLDDVARTIDLDFSTILAEQIKDPVLATNRSWIRKEFSPEPKTPKIQQ